MEDRLLTVKQLAASRVRGFVAGLVALVLVLLGQSCQPEPMKPPRLSQAIARPSPEPPAGTELGLPPPSSPRIPIGRDDAGWGSPVAPATVVAFVDFQCPFAARGWMLLGALAERYGAASLRIVVKHYPLPSHALGLPAALASQIVLELRGPGAFRQFADRVFAGQRELSLLKLRRLAVSLGVPGEEYDRRLAEPGGSARQKVESDVALASALGVSGTPHFRINGRALVGAQPLDELVARVDAELGAAQALSARGVPASEVYAVRVAANLAEPPADREEPTASVRADVAWPVPLRGSPERGPRDALVTIVEFADFECPFCALAQKTVDEVMRRYPRDVRLVFKHFPLDAHRRARPAAMLALWVRARRGDAGFFAAADAMFARHGRLDDAELRGVGQRLGLGAAEVERALGQSSPHQAAIDADLDLGAELEVEGTPQFFVNGTRLGGALPVGDFVEVVDSELVKARAMVARGVPRARLYDAIVRDATGPAPEKKSIAAPTVASPTRGPSSAPIEIQVFADFECPFCRRGEATLAELERAHPGQIRVTWRNLPLAGHRHARAAARAALEAFAQRGNQGFWRMHDLLYAGQDQEDGLGLAALEGYARRLGLDVERFRQALADQRHDATLTADESAAVMAGIDGTPAFLVNGYFIAGARPLGVFERVVRYALRQASAAPGAVPPGSQRR
jgi:protein-disulfide isomerase